MLLAAIGHILNGYTVNGWDIGLDVAWFCFVSSFCHHVAGSRKWPWPEKVGVNQLATIRQDINRNWEFERPKKSLTSKQTGIDQQKEDMGCTKNWDMISER
jgi:hypothetical protein